MNIQSNSLLYFEVGNEPNIRYDPTHWPDFYAFSASAIYQQLTQSGYTNFRILTGGILSPQVTDNCSPVTTLDALGQPVTTPNIRFAYHAITEAEDNQHVPESYLGISIHPYGYTTNQMYYFNNWSKFQPKLTSPCTDLYQMLVEWRTHSRFQNLPIVFSETNWTSDPNNSRDCGAPTGNFPLCSPVENGLITSYLVDLFTWLRDRGYTGPGGAIRVLWFRPADDASPGAGHLGLYDKDGNLKTFNPSTTDPQFDNTLRTCPANPSLLNRYVSMAQVYTFVVGAACYDSHGN